MVQGNLQKRLKGTKTEVNLNEAFAGESKARNKYTFFADLARDDGYEQMADIYIETASNEREHAEIWLEYLGGMGNVEENLINAIAGEDYEATTMYKRMAKEAREEGFDEIARKFELIMGIEASHARRFTKVLQTLRSNRTFVSDTPISWLCLNCGYIHEGKEAPKSCPFCGYPEGFFERLCENY